MIPSRPIDMMAFVLGDQYHQSLLDDDLPASMVFDESFAEP